MRRKPNQAVEKAAQRIALLGSARFRWEWISSIRSRVTRRRGGLACAGDA